MSHANDMIVGQTQQYFDVTLEGPLSEHIVGIARAIRKAEGVVETTISRKHKSIRVTFELTAYPDDDIKQLRYRVRNRLRDYIGNTTGFMSNMGENGSYADLIEDTLVDA
jgi:hypothetical protein